MLNFIKPGCSIIYITCYVNTTHEIEMITKETLKMNGPKIDPWGARYINLSSTAIKIVMNYSQWFPIYAEGNETYRGGQSSRQQKQHYYVDVKILSFISGRKLELLLQWNIRPR